jgi:hypothetical protein
MLQKQSPLSRLFEPMVPRSELQRSEADKALRNFLDNVNCMVIEKREAYFGQGRKYNLPIPQSIAKPQVFFSYAWGQAGDPRFVQLQAFLSGMSNYLRIAGIHVWFDLERMLGDIESQMRDGVIRSDLILLFGTEIYAQKTAGDNQTNVKKELDFSLEKAAQDKHCLMPLLLEGNFKTTFSGLGYKYIIVDTTPWIDLDHGRHQMQAYIKALTSLTNPVGILPAALGLQRLDDDYQDYRDSCRDAYAIHESVLIMQLEKIYSPLPVQQAAGEPGKHPEEKHIDSVNVKASIEINKLQQALSEKQQAIHAFENDNGSRADLEETLAGNKQKLASANKLKQKSLAGEIADIETALASLSILESEQTRLEQEISALTGKAIFASSHINVSAAGATIFNSQNAVMARVKAAPKEGVEVNLKVDNARIEGSEGAMLGVIEFG